MTYDFVLSEECLAFGKELGFSELRHCTTGIFMGKGIDENKQAIRHNGISVLADPADARGICMDTALLTVAKDKEKAILFSLRPILEARNYQRAKVIHNMCQAMALAKKSRATVLVASLAQDKYGMRPPQQLAAFGQMLGMSRKEAEWAITEAPKKFMG